jgi:hypothetical protein
MTATEITRPKPVDTSFEHNHSHTIARMTLHCPEPLSFERMAQAFLGGVRRLCEENGVPVENVKEYLTDFKMRDLNVFKKKP